MRMMRRRGDGSRYSAGVALILACYLILGTTGCRSRQCTVNPPERTVEVPAASVTDLNAAIVSAMETPGPATLTLREEELTALLRQAITRLPAHEATIRVTERALYVQVAAGRSRVPIRAALSPDAEGGRMSVRVACLTVGDRPMPRAVGAAIESVIDALAADAAWSVHVESVALQEGSLTVTVAPRALPRVGCYQVPFLGASSCSSSWPFSDSPLFFAGASPPAGTTTGLLTGSKGLVG